jgi:phosphoribosyl-ATP pyrophosphohydrolase
MKKALYIVIIVILLGVFGVSAYMVGSYLIENKQQQDMYGDLAAIKDQAKPTTEATEPTEETYDPNAPMETIPIHNEDGILLEYEGLYEMIKGRKDEPKEGSYTTYLFEKGMDKILKKVGEECAEVIIGAAKGDKEEATYEIADLAYHVMVMMVEQGITMKDVTGELAKRHVVDHKVKQERMK